jgi:hypothetical protein
VNHTHVAARFSLPQSSTSHTKTNVTNCGPCLTIPYPVLWAPIGFWRKILFLTVWDEYNMVAKNQLVNWNLFHFFFKKKYTSLSWWLDEVYTPPRINLDNHKNAMAEWAQWKVQIFKYSLLPATSSCHILPQVWGNSWWILAPYWSPQEYSSRFLFALIN